MSDAVSARDKLAAIVEAKRAGDPFVDPLSSVYLAWWALRYSEEVLALIEAAQDFSRGSRASGAGLAPAEMQRRYDNLAAALDAVGLGEGDGE